MRNIMLTSTMLGVLLAPSLGYAEKPNTPGNLEKHLVEKITDKVGISRPRDKLNELRPSYTNDKGLRVREVGNKTVVTGVVIHHGNVYEQGQNAEAVGARIDVESKGSALVDVTAIQRGNVSASAEGGNEAASAKAAGVQLNLRGANNATVNLRSSVQGNVTASASGNNNISASSAAAEVTGIGRGAKATISNQSQGTISATGIGR